MNFRNKIFMSLLVVILGLSGCWSETTLLVSFAPAMVVSVSSDGQYVISSHQDKHIVLWDIKLKTKKTISSNGNIYSAYFVKNTDMFMWQDLDDIVHVQKVDGAEVKKFKHLPTYGHVITSDLQHYISSDVGWSLYYGYGDSLRKFRDGGLQSKSLAYGKLLNLTLSPDDKKMLIAGSLGSMDEGLLIEEQALKLYTDMDGVILWDIASLKPIAQLTGNSAKTNATISPDGKYVVSGCENGLGYVWDSKTGDRLLKLGSVFHGITIRIGDNIEDWQYDKTNLIPYPKDLDSHHGAKLATKFIANNFTYLQFLTSSPYAVLYDVNNPLPLKYLPLGRTPFPSVTKYSRNASIDTAPAVGILVTGQASKGGINVYQYHPDKQELEKIWVAK